MPIPKSLQASPGLVKVDTISPRIPPGGALVISSIFAKYVTTIGSDKDGNSLSLSELIGFPLPA